MAIDGRRTCASASVASPLHLIQRSCNNPCWHLACKKWTLGDKNRKQPSQTQTFVTKVAYQCNTCIAWLDLQWSDLLFHPRAYQLMRVCRSYAANSTPLSIAVQKWAAKEPATSSVALGCVCVPDVSPVFAAVAQRWLPPPPPPAPQHGARE
jgi:hypothetical protein